MYTIKEISENDKEQKELIRYSGYCIITLITKKIEPNSVQIDDDTLVECSFGEYDYSYRGKRQSNSYYINATNDYLRKNR